jgi:hypothetical protein
MRGIGVVAEVVEAFVAGMGVFQEDMLAEEGQDECRILEVALLEAR